MLVLCSARAQAAGTAEASATPGHLRRVDGPPQGIVIVLADDLGWADVGYQGSTFCRTPCLDALARDGLAFSQAYAAAPTCSPARAALFTGLAPARLRLTDAIGVVRESPKADSATVRSRQKLASEVPSLARLLGAAGYRTALIGKWHLGTDPRAHGFELVQGVAEGGAVTSYFDTELPGLPAAEKGAYLDERLTAQAVRFLEEHKDERFLLVLSHYAPHTPLEAPPEAVARAQERVRSPRDNPTYAAMVESLDASVGTVRATLERLELVPRTLLVFASDNGGLRTHIAPGKDGVSVTSNAPLRAGKHELYEGGIRVPWILYGGPVQRRGTCDTPIVGMDLLPTLLGLCALAPPEPLDGVDLSPLLVPGGTLAPRRLYFHYPHRSGSSAVRDGDAKLIHFWATGRSELYSLADDVGETQDLAALQPERTAELRAALLAWLEAVKANVPGREER